MKTLFVVTYGRTGSTLVQMALNSINGIEIAGEDGGFMRRMYEAQKSLENRRDRVSVHGHVLSTANPFYSLDMVKSENLQSHIREMLWDNWSPARRMRTWVVNELETPIKQPWCIGQKEIRWCFPDTIPYLEWVQDVFGIDDTGFIFLTRRPQDVARSGWWASGVDSFDRVFTMQTQLERAMKVEGIRQRSVLIKYENLVDPRADGWDKLNQFLVEKMGMNENLALSATEIDVIMSEKASF